MRLWICAMLVLTAGCATGRDLGPSPAFAKQTDSCSELGAAWDQHWIETFDQLTLGELLDPEPEVESNWGLRIVRFPFALTTDVVTLAGMGTLGTLVEVPVHTYEDVRPESCREAD